MTNQRLTTNALLRYLRGNNSEKAILQVVGIKTIYGKTDDLSRSSKRYRLMLSDGESTFSSCMLGTQLNELIETNALKENSIVRLDRVMANTIDKQNGRVMLMLYELEVLQSDCERIGNPVALPLTDIINHISSINHIDDRNSKGINIIDKQQIINIDTLNPYMNKWTIKVRVDNKSPIRSFTNARGPGKFFHCDLVDQSSTIRAIAFNADCDKFHSILKVGEIYYITKASFTPANGQFNTTNNKYEMRFHHDTIIELCDKEEEEENLPQVQFNFISISEIANRTINSSCDVIGVIKSISDIQTVVSKATQKEFLKRVIILMDEKASIPVTFWDKKAEEFDASLDSIIAFKGIRITDFNGPNLSCINNTLVYRNPMRIQRTIELRVWYDNEGKSIDLPVLPKETSDINNRKTPMKTICQITPEGLDLGGKSYYINIKAMCTSIKKDSVVYMMCPEDNCRKKVIDENNGYYRCEKCNKTYDNFKWAFMISAEISDVTGAQWITLFRNEAEMLLGINVNEFGNYKLNQNESIIEDIIRKAMNHERIFKLQIKVEQYNNEPKLRFNCIKISDIDWSTYGKHLIDEIEPIKN